MHVQASTQIPVFPDPRRFRRFVERQAVRHAAYSSPYAIVIITCGGLGLRSSLLTHIRRHWQQQQEEEEHLEPRDSRSILVLILCSTHQHRHITITITFLLTEKRRQEEGWSPWHAVHDKAFIRKSLCLHPMSFAILTACFPIRMV